MIYQKLSKQFPAKKLKNFYDQVLPGKTLEQCQNLIKKSSIIIGAFDKNELIGIGRALDDGVYAFITDIMVRPNHQKKGVGSSITKMLCDSLLKKNIKMIHCSTSKRLIPFYQKSAGFEFDSDDVTLYLKNF